MPNLIKQDKQKLPITQKEFLPFNTNRRVFLQYIGMGAVGIAFTATGCKKDDKEGVYLGSDDVAILNYAYALEQLQAGFYDQVVQAFYTGATEAERALILDVRDHETAHREFFKNALGEVGIPTVDLDFSTVSFGSRDSVLKAAKDLEDLVVAAYNGIGPLITDPDYITLIGKIVSVEARHAALMRNLISNGSFANSEVIDANGLDRSLSPTQVLAIAATYIKSPINAEDLPPI